MQSKTASMIEAVANVSAGYVISFGLTVSVLPLFGYDVTLPDAFGISLVFVAASLLRSYALRRWFNGRR